MNVCQDITLLNILKIFKDLLGIVQIVIPAVLVIFVIIEVIKTIVGGDVDTKKLFNSISRRIIAAAIIFVLPMIVNVILGLFGDNEYINCYNNANKTYISKVAIQQADDAIEQIVCEDLNTYEKARIAVKKIPDKATRKSYEESLNTIKKGCNKK